QHCEKRNQIKEEPVAIGLALKELDGREKENEMCEYRNLHAAAFACFKKLNLEIGRENTPIKIENRNRKKNEDESNSLGELPARVFEFEGNNHHQNKGTNQPATYAAGAKQCQRRSSDRRVRGDSKISREAHESQF